MLVLQQASRHVEMALLRGDEQRRGTAGLGEVDAGAGPEQDADGPEMPFARRHDQRGRAAPPSLGHVGAHSAVAVGARSEQRTHLALRAQVVSSA